ncbi:short-chain dehydrogenase reductase sdr [Ophiostoma piceae UAMH 11346]|uniref:Short-chain dehydrogenase reductase sdr n=1 Tax=Ophiostoma piceae (strain UAMH 11346) TaxID=1262450 RepID=S3D4Y7_OPHP1|nr:short-chain dehydrogenase reductase sdr [Ophiostoma piceae UAMH 11346]
MDNFNFPSRSLQGRVAIVTGAAFTGRVTNGCAIAIMLARDGCNVICVNNLYAGLENTVSFINAEQAKHAGLEPLRPQAVSIKKPEATGLGNSQPGRQGTDAGGGGRLPQQQPVQAQTADRPKPSPGTSATKLSNGAIGMPGRAVPFKCDIKFEADCAAAVQLALDTFGRLDILVNNTGIVGASGTAVEVDMDEWVESMDINVGSMVRMTKYAVPAMQVCGNKTGKEKSGGSIINMGSVTGLRGGAPHLLYPTSKAAVVGMSKAMAGHFGPLGVRVNCVCPGIGYQPATFGEGTLKELSLLGTEGTPGDVAAAVVFLASDHARWITGTDMIVDAGATAVVNMSLPKAASAAIPLASGGKRPAGVSTAGAGVNGHGPGTMNTNGNGVKPVSGSKQPVHSTKQ